MMDQNDMDKLDEEQIEREFEQQFVSLTALEQRFHILRQVEENTKGIGDLFEAVVELAQVIRKVVGPEEDTKHPRLRHGAEWGEA